MEAGYINITSGLICVLISFLCLTVFGIKNRKANNKKKIISRIAIALFLIFINFPTALAIISSVTYELSAYNITVSNNSNYLVRNFSILEGEKETIIGNIDSKDMLKKTINFNYEGSVEYKFSLNEKDYSGILISYVTSGMSFSVDLIVTEDEKVLVDANITD